MKKRTMIALPLAVSMLGLLLSGCGKKIDVNQFATTAAAPAATQAAGGAADASIDFVLLDAVNLEGLDKPQHAVVKGDAKVLAIAAASIVAKVTRDRMMVEFAKEYPWYAFEKNKGYGTAAHYEGIREHGTCPIHRMTFLKNLK